MAYEVTRTLKMNRGTVRKPRYKVVDIHGGTPPDISSATFELRNAKTGQIVDSGSATINNADTDPIGNTVKTVQPTVNLNQTDIDEGSHQLSIKITFANSESDVVRQPIDIVDYEEIT